VGVGHAADGELDSERRRAHEVPFGSDSEHYRALIETLPALIWTSRPDGSVEFCNRTLLDYTQYSFEQIRGHAWLEMVDPEDRERTRAVWTQALRTGERLEHECRMYCAPERTFRWVLVRGEPMRDAQGAIVRWCGTAADIERRKRIEEALERADSLLVHSQRAARVGSFMAEYPDPTRGIEGLVQWSDEFYRIFGYQPGGVPATRASWFARIHPDDRQRVSTAIEEARRDHRAFELEFRIIVDESVRTLISWAEYETGPPERVWGTCQDVTEQRHATTELREADRRKNEFLAILAHELRNPLAPIRQSVVVAQSGRASEPQRQRALEIIERQVAQMARLLDDLLEASRISHGRLELRRQPTTLSPALLAAVETARPLIESRGHALTVEVPEESIWLEADPVRLAQIFTNLLTNAAKYTDAHGRISLKVTTDARQAVVSVRDNGIGISTQMLPRVFDMFSQAHVALERTQGGLGIGLALARGLVALHGGNIEARSAGLGHGSEFIVRLPTLPRSLRQTRPAETPAAKAPPARRILVADDNPDAADSLAMTLKLRGHELEVAHDGRQALAIAAIMHPDIALLDIGMPVFNGYELARQIRSEPWGRSMRLIAVTGWGQEEDRRLALEAGFDDHLTKPVDPDKLIELIEAREPHEEPHEGDDRREHG
jgi:PAS domain S-box-containing protein